MNQVAIDIWPMVVTALLTAVGTYVGFIHRLRIATFLDMNKKD